MCESGDTWKVRPYMLLYSQGRVAMQGFLSGMTKPGWHKEWPLKDKLKEYDFIPSLTLYSPFAFLNNLNKFFIA